jgi:hypothetical protein
MPLPAAMPRLGGCSRALRFSTPTPTPTIARLPLTLLVAAAPLWRRRNGSRMDRLHLHALTPLLA